MDALFLPELIVLVPLAFCAGLIDAAVGGGGLIQLPALFATLPQTVPASLLGTNKFASIMGTASATWRYSRRLNLNWSLLLPCATSAFVGAYFGAHVVNLLPIQWVRTTVITLLIIMVVYTLIKPDFGQNSHHRTLTHSDYLLGLTLGLAIGFYDGFFGPGTGSFLIFLFIRFFHFDFLNASASAKIVNVSTNLAALLFFIPAKLVIFGIAIPMAIANIAGAIIGTRLAIQGGNVWVRRLFLLLATVLLLKLIWDSAR